MKAKQFQYLRIKTSKGFSFRIPNSIVLTTYPSMGIIFFLQSSVRFFDGSQFSQLYKTENPISCISLRDRQLAIGEKLLKGQLTTTTLLNLETKKTKIYRYQKTAIEILSLSEGGEYLCSVGASDPNKQELLVIDLLEDLEFGFKTVCEQEYERKTSRIVAAKFSNTDPKLLAITFATQFVILRIQGNKSMQKVAKSSKVRQFSMAIFDPKDISCYISSKNGDISEINLKQMKQVRIGPRKRVIISGIKFIRHVDNGMAKGAGVVVVVGVKGFIGLIQLGQMRILKEVTIKEEIVSITQFQGDLAFIGTQKASIYILDAATLDIRQFYSCHSSKITQVCFLETFNEVFATCADKEIILWRNNTLNPILKISLPMASCISLNLLRDGTSIVSGWSDDCIRFFNPKTGKKINEIVNAHNGKITALTSNYGSDLLFSGGEDGRIRSWKLEKQRFGVIDNIFSGHKALIHYLKLYQGELYSCSQDGTFAIWDAKKAEKKCMVKVSNFLKKIIPIDEYLVYGVGSGPNLLKIAKNDGRVLQTKFVGGSHLNDFDIFMAPDKQSERKFIIFGGQLHSVFLHKVEELLGQSTMKPEQHYAYGQVTCVKFSPDGNTAIAATADGSLLCFEFLVKGYAINDK